MTIDELDSLLKKKFGNKVLRPHGDPVGELVRTILSQNTSDVNRDQAYRRLRMKFPRWEDLLNARVTSIQAAIKSGGLAAIKAPRIKKILKEIDEENERIDLSGLKRKTVSRGMKYLMSFNGVGEKTAACVLLFSFGKKVFPVDTHIYRVAQRLNLIPENCGREKAFEILNDMVPEKYFYRLHLNLIELGRKVCKPKKPKCVECTLNKLCPSAFSFED
ncbi:MAG: endonuclease III [candidate division Zixibacteria bacterium]|nr:endonuclease III [candidate division Zixibacteria bacterium]